MGNKFDDKPFRVPKTLYLIDRDFQLRYAGVAFCVGLCSALLTMVLILYPLYQFKIIHVPLFLPNAVFLLMGLVVLVQSAMIWLSGVYVTHKMAGPMYSLVRHFRKIGQGHFHGHMSLRPGDELKFVVRNFNEMIDAVVIKGGGDLKKIESLIQISHEDSLDSGEKVTKIVELCDAFAAELRKRYHL